MRNVAWGVRKMPSFLPSFRRWLSQSGARSGGDGDATPCRLVAVDVQPPDTIKNEPLLSSGPPFAEGREALGQWDTFST